MRLRLLFLFSVIYLTAFSQSGKIDSLKNLTLVERPDTQRASSAYYLFREYFKTGKLDSANLFNGLIYSLYKNTGNPKFYASYLNNLGAIQHSSGSYDSSIYYYRLSLRYREKAGDEWGIAQAYNNMGNSYTNMGDLQKAIESHEKSLQIKRKLKDKKGIGQSLYNIGNTKVGLGLMKEALEHYLESLKLGEETGYHELVMNAYGAIGNIYNQVKDYEKARIHFEKALDLAEKQNDKKVMAISLSNLGTYYYHMEDTLMAGRLLRKALDIDEVIGNRYGMAMIYNSIGSMEMDHGNFEKALAFYDLSLNMANAIGHTETQCLVYVNTGSVFLKQKRYAEALERANKGLEIAEETESMKNIMDFHQLKALAYAGTKKYKEAYEEFVLWGNMKDSLNGLNNVRELATMEMKADYQKQQALQKAEQEKKDAVAAEEAKKERVIRFSLIGVATFILLIAFVVYRGYRTKAKDNIIIKSQKEEVEQQKKIVEEKRLMVEEKNKEILDSITYAKRLQEAILPRHETIARYLPGNFILYLPKDIIAGDFFWFHVDEEASNAFIAAADCTGHGVPGAMVSVVCSNALNRSVKEFGLNDPGKILDKTRELVLETFSASQAENSTPADVKDGMDISLSKISLRDKGPVRISWAGANNPLWYVQANELKEITASKQPIGKTDQPKPFSTHHLELNKGDVLYLFTDGFADQFGGAKGKKFKYKPMKELLLSASSKIMEDQHAVLKNEFMKWKGNLEQIDDVCVIGIRI